MAVAVEYSDAAVAFNSVSLVSRALSISGNRACGFRRKLPRDDGGVNSTSVVLVVLGVHVSHRRR